MSVFKTLILTTVTISDILVFKMFLVGVSIVLVNFEVHLFTHYDVCTQPIGKDVIIRVNTGFTSYRKLY